MRKGRQDAAQKAWLGPGRCCKLGRQEPLFRVNGKKEVQGVLLSQMRSISCPWPGSNYSPMTWCALASLYTHHPPLLPPNYSTPPLSSHHTGPFLRLGEMEFGLTGQVGSAAERGLVSLGRFSSTQRRAEKTACHLLAGRHMPVPLSREPPSIPWGLFLPLPRDRFPETAQAWGSRLSACKARSIAYSALML